MNEVAKNSTKSSSPRISETGSEPDFDAILALWSQRERLQADVEAADVDEGVRAANDKLASVDDRIMASRAATIGDLDIKARVLSSRRQLGGYIDEDYLDRLLADIRTLATGSI